MLVINCFNSVLFVSMDFVLWTCPIVLTWAASGPLWYKQKPGPSRRVGHSPLPACRNSISFSYFRREESPDPIDRRRPRSRRMGYVLRVRLASFVTGAALASAAGIYFLHKDYKIAHHSISQQVPHGFYVLINFFYFFFSCWDIFYVFWVIKFRKQNVSLSRILISVKSRGF